MTRRLSSIITLVLATTLLVAAPPAALQPTVARLLADPALQGAQVGILIQSLQDGSYWYEQHADATFIPASTAKAVTSALALEFLGPQYRFSTRVLMDGCIMDGVLYGDLYLQGGGDPTLLPDDLRTLAHNLATGDPARGLPPLRGIRGHLRLDDSFFPRPGALRGPGWEAGDLPWYYAAPASALTCNENALTVTVQGTTPGNPPQVILSPLTGLFRIDNHARTSVKTISKTAAVNPQGYTLRITGDIAPGKTLTERISIPHPLRFAAEQFLLALEAEGISVSVIADGVVNPRKQQVLYEHQSAPLADIVVPMLKESDNQTAEQLRWTLLALYSLNPPLDAQYPSMLEDFMTHSGIYGSRLALVDGSGLSRLNRLSPASLVRLMSYMALSPNYPLYYQALPIAGVDGTLQRRMVGTPAVGNAHAKTGTMRGVCSLAGYVTTAHGEPLVFAFLVNGYAGGSTPVRTVQDALVAYLASL